MGGALSHAASPGAVQRGDLGRAGRLFEDLTRDEVLALLENMTCLADRRTDRPTCSSILRFDITKIIFEIDRPPMGPGARGRPAGEGRPRPVGTATRVAGVGAHTDEVLTEAGYGPEAIAPLRRTGVVA